MNVVYFNMNGNTLKLAGGSKGAGILLVDGNLDLSGASPGMERLSSQEH